MKLTRRDAVAALIAGGAGVGAVGMATVGTGDRSAGPPLESATTLDDVPEREALESDPSEPLDTIVAVAEVIFPPEVEGVREFVVTYVEGLPEAERSRMYDAAEGLDHGTTLFRDRPFVELSPGARDDVLRELGVAVAVPDPEGGAAERVRHDLVNELLYALFTSPAGSALVGIDNPIGYPGGYDSYREEP